MNALDSLKIESYIEDHLPNEYPGGDLPWQVYQTVRNSLVRASRQVGPTGPMGEVKIVAGVADPYLQWGTDRSFWESGDPEAIYDIEVDQYNSEKYCYADVNRPDAFNADWLTSVTAALRSHDGWGLGIRNIPLGYVLIFGTKVMVNGRLARCRTPLEVLEVGRSLLQLQRIERELHE
jgi:hypothetical protein